MLFKPYGPITAVLELWPSRHSSPKHQHGGCAGSVRLMHGNLLMRLYDTLQGETPMRIRGLQFVLPICCLHCDRLVDGKRVEREGERSLERDIEREREVERERASERERERERERAGE